MPWKGEKDPYKIWLSEIILQQTRVEQGLAYFEKFIAAFPSIHDLAASQNRLTTPEEDTAFDAAMTGAGEPICLTARRSC